MMPTWFKDRVTRRDLLWIALLGLIVQALWGLRLTHPSYYDGYYYTLNAQNLANGDGFTANVIWQYLDDPAGLPAPSFTYWMPLPAMLAGAGYWLTGSFRGAQVPFWLLAGLMPWLAYAIGWRLSGQRWQARTAALFTMAGGYYAAYWVQPSTFALFGFVGAACLLSLSWALERQTAVYWGTAGLLAGLGHLARADGVLLLVVAGLLWLGLLWQNRRLPAAWRQLVVNMLSFGMCYLLIMGGWFWRTYQVTGAPLSVVGTQTMFLTEYNDVFAYGRTFTLSSYLSWGWGNILRSKVEGLWLALQTFIGVTGLTAFAFFVVWGWIDAARKPAARGFLRPFTWYTLILYAAMSLVFTFPGQRGSLLHSSTAIWPWSMALAVVGLDTAVNWIAARRTTWQPQQAKRIFSVAFVVMIWLISWAVSQRLPLGDEEAQIYTAVAAQLPPDTVVMTGDPPGFHFHTRIAALTTPNEPLAGVLAVADRYGARYLLLDPDRPPLMDGLYGGEETNPRLTRIWEVDGYQLYRVEASN